MKKHMKIRMILMALTALLSLASCSDDYTGIQLTQDEIIGDINTGKKLPITTLTICYLLIIVRKLYWIHSI